MVRAPALLAVMVLVAAGCGDGGEQEPGAPPSGGGLTLGVAFDPDPPEAGKPVTWSLTVGNGGAEAVTLTFSSGKRGDVVLEGEGGGEAYRWSDGRFFTEALSRQELGPGQEVVYRLEEPSLSVEPGDYTLVATLAAEPEVGPDRQRVQIR